MVKPAVMKKNSVLLMLKSVMCLIEIWSCSLKRVVSVTVVTDLQMIGTLLRKLRNVLDISTVRSGIVTVS